MVLKNTIRQVAVDQQSFIKQEKKGILRDKLKDISINASHVIIISGIRRCGKSTLLKQIMNRVDAYFYFSFEDQRVFNFDVNDFEKLFEIALELNPENKKFFFDEIQNINGWERFVRSKHDLGYKFFITGSNATMISRELGTRLTGRNLRYELFPFDFNEFVRIKNAEFNVGSFKNFLVEGGFPEYLQFNNLEILQHIFTDVIDRDVVIRHNIRNERKFKELTIHLLSNVGKEFSFTRLKNIFDLGATNSVINYLSFLEECYLIKILNKFSYSYPSRINSPKKVYAIDNGLINAVSVSFSEDYGRLLENTVFNFLNKHYDEIFYFNEQHECDFIVRHRNDVILAIQVCYELNEENIGREIKGLKEACDKTNASEMLIVTLDQKDTIDGIQIVPAWQWMQSANPESFNPA